MGDLVSKIRAVREPGPSSININVQPYVGFIVCIKPSSFKQSLVLGICRQSPVRSVTVVLWADSDNMICSSLARHLQ